MAHSERHSGDSDDILAAALASGKTVRAAAKDARIGESTAHRRNADPAFRARVRALRAEMVAAGVGRLADGMTRAAGVLRQLLDHPDPDVRHKAAVKIIELGLKGFEKLELETRVAELEAKLADPPPEGTP